MTPDPLSVLGCESAAVTFVGGAWFVLVGSSIVGEEGICGLSIEGFGSGGDGILWKELACVNGGVSGGGVPIEDEKDLYCTFSEEAGGERCMFCGVIGIDIDGSFSTRTPLSPPTRFG